MPKQVTGKGRGGGGLVPEIEEGIRTLVDLSIKNQEIRDKVRIDKKLQERGERFKHEFERLDKPECAYGVRITAVPVGDDLRIPRICRPWGKLVEGIKTPSVTVERHNPDSPPTPIGGRIDLHHRIRNSGWTPQLRAARIRSPHEDLPAAPWGYYLELHCDGLVEFGLMSVIRDEDDPLLYSDYAVWAFANVIYWADTLRRYAGAGQVEYAVQIALHVNNEKVFVVPEARVNNPWGQTRVDPKLSPGLTTMPTYTLSDVSEAEEMLSTFERDLWNAGGKNYPDNKLSEFKVTCE